MIISILVILIIILLVSIVIMLVFTWYITNTVFKRINYYNNSKPSCRVMSNIEHETRLKNLQRKK